MELTLILLGATLLLGMLSPIAFAVFLFTRGRRTEETAPTTNV